MGLILKDRLTMLIKGYPTVSDKYNVSGAMLAGSTPVKFGDLVKRSSTPGYFEAITDTVTLADIAGFVLATNVKLAENYPGTLVQVNPGEAFNLMINGFIAIELNEDAVAADIIANAPVYVVLADGKLTTSTNASEGAIVALPNCVFTGIYEEHADGALYAEIYVK